MTLRRDLILILAVAVSLIIGLQCTQLVDPRSDARIVVYIHRGEMGIAKKKVGPRETGETNETNEVGLAEFIVPPGKYTVRIYNINRGRPSDLYYDFTVDVQSDETKILDVVDCLPCV